MWLNYNGAMRNSGWYIPFWRRSKKKGKAEKPSTDNISRTDEQLEAVRQRWIERYRRTSRSLKLLGLSMGNNRSEVQARYEQLRQSSPDAMHEIEDAYRFLMRILPAQERRKRRSGTRRSTELTPDGDQRATASAVAAGMEGSFEEDGDEADVVEDVEEEVVDVGETAYDIVTYGDESVHDSNSALGGSDLLMAESDPGEQRIGAAAEAPDGEDEAPEQSAT